MLVMVAISMSLVLTLSFVRTQATVDQMTQNGMRGDLALQAAHAGAAHALREIHTATWSGVTSTLNRTVTVDKGGTSSYSVRYQPTETLGGEHPATHALRLRVISTGNWTGLRDSSRRVEKVVEVHCELVPRVPGKGSTSAWDEVANPGAFDVIQNYALYCRGAGTSLVLDPCDRIDGNIFLDDRLTLYGDPAWSSSEQADFLSDVGNRFTSNGVARFPHPFAGTITFQNKPSGSVQTQLQRLKSSWTSGASQLSEPAVSESGWQSYRLYSGGFEYQAESLGSYLSNTTLGPSASNPLGLFYRSGNVTIGDNVQIIGTVVSSGQVRFSGDDSYVTAFDYLDQSGQPVADDAQLWRRLPAIVADSVTFDRDCRVAIHGAVLVDQALSGAGGTFEFVWTPDIRLTGTATAAPAAQPYSNVQINGQADLSSVTANGNYAIWLADSTGRTGRWYVIKGVDAERRQLTVLGEVKTSSAVSFRIWPKRENFVDIQGSVYAERVDINRPDEWVLSGYLWNYLNDRWKDNVRYRERLNLPTIGFSELLEDPSNFLLFGWPYSSYGLNLEPTFQLQYDSGKRYQFKPPLFRPYASGQPNSADDGYRWRILRYFERRNTTAGGNQS